MLVEDSIGASFQLTVCFKLVIFSDFSSNFNFIYSSSERVTALNEDFYSGADSKSTHLLFFSLLVLTEVGTVDWFSEVFDIW